jgi:hypothetical protein
LVDRKASAADDAGDVGTTSVEALIRGLIEAGAPSNPRPPTTDRVPTIPPASGHGRKRIHTAVKWTNSIPRVDQVMSQVKLLPYRGPHSPLDLVVVEIVLDAYLRHFTQCHRPQLLVPCPLMMISLYKRGIIGYQLRKNVGTEVFLYFASLSSDLLLC